MHNSLYYHLLKGSNEKMGGYKYLIETIKKDYNEALAAKSIKVADKCCNVLFNLLDEYQGVPPYESNNSINKWTELLVAATYIYYITFDPSEPIRSIFVLREKYDNAMTEAGLSGQEKEFLCQTLETARGIEGPSKLKAQPSTPSELFALAVWLLRWEYRLYYPPTKIVDMIRTLNGVNKEEIEALQCESCAD